MNETIKLFEEFNSIKITTICKDLGLNYSNIINGKSTKENEEKVKKILMAKIFKFWLKIQFGVDEDV